MLVSRGSGQLGITLVEVKITCAALSLLCDRLSYKWTLTCSWFLSFSDFSLYLDALDYDFVSVFFLVACDLSFAFEFECLAYRAFPHFVDIVI